MPRGVLQERVRCDVCRCWLAADGQSSRRRGCLCLYPRYQDDKLPVLARNLDEQVCHCSRRFGSSGAPALQPVTQQGTADSLLQPPLNTHLCHVQIKGAAKYSLDVGVAVLRLYQLRPEMADKALIARALLRALMEMPRPDYRVLLHLLPDRLVVRAQQHQSQQQWDTQ